ncbi:hypothetical protein MKK55_11275 [Methylobacterium sp. J-059]|uniref:hypothetical protein n=1 Tax=Methylobacterium sp. J-059 TaxID=2836643 RepID=UPI001FBBA101|nr:hypothetical protein [Methylobacterium sp. J-059]MCJ2039516.1 hypothetical protein [Methylobacterium sp. J-059]
MTNPDIAALKRELAEAKAELAASRRSEAVRSAVAKRSFADPAAVEAMVVPRITTNENGQIVAVDEHGSYRIGKADGAYMSVNEVLDEIERTDPDVHMAETRNVRLVNPFLAKTQNLSDAMILFRENPELAREYALKAGINLEIR